MHKHHNCCWKFDKYGVGVKKLLEILMVKRKSLFSTSIFRFQVRFKYKIHSGKIFLYFVFYFILKNIYQKKKLGIRLNSKSSELRKKTFEKTFVKRFIQILKKM